MPKVEDAKVFYAKEAGMYRLSDGTYVMGLTAEARIPADLHLLQKLNELLAEVKRTNRFLATLTNSIE